MVAKKTSKKEKTPEVEVETKVEQTTGGQVEQASVQEDTNMDTATAQDFLTAENDERLPLSFENRKIEQVLGRKESGGVVYYSCLCEDGATYDVPVLSK